MSTLHIGMCFYFFESSVARLRHSVIGMGEGHLPNSFRWEGLEELKKFGKHCSVLTSELCTNFKLYTNFKALREFKVLL